MRTSTALTSYPCVSSSSSLPLVTAAQITSHWSSRFVEHQLPALAAVAQHNANTQPASSASYLAYLHSASSASLAFPSAAFTTSSSHTSAHYSPTFLPALKPAPLSVRRKQHFSVDEEMSQSSGSESSTDLAVLTQQLSAVRLQRRQRGLGKQRDDSSSMEQSTSDSDNNTAAGKRGDRRRTVSVARVSEQRARGTEAEEEEGAVAAEGDVEADDELTSPSIERADELELSICQKTRQLSSQARDEKEDVAYHSVSPGVFGVQFVEHSTDGW